MIEKVISGGQTGADLAGLKAARSAGILTGGTACKGWQTEDGPAPWLADFGLIECPTPGYPARTRRNIEAADTTLIFLAGKGGPGTKLTLDIIRERKAPHALILRGDGPWEADLDTPETTAWWLTHRGVKVLNIAGSRESGAPGVGAWVEKFLVATFLILRDGTTPRRLATET